MHTFPPVGRSFASERVLSMGTLPTGPLDLGQDRAGATDFSIRVRKETNRSLDPRAIRAGGCRSCLLDRSQGRMLLVGGTHAADVLRVGDPE